MVLHDIIHLNIWGNHKVHWFVNKCQLLINAHFSFSHKYLEMLDESFMWKSISTELLDGYLFSCIFSSLSMCNFLTFEQTGFPFICQHRHSPKIFLFSNLLYSLSPWVVLTDSKCFEKHGTHPPSDWTLNYFKTVLFCFSFSSWNYIGSPAIYIRFETNPPVSHNQCRISIPKDLPGLICDNTQRSHKGENALTFQIVKGECFIL